MIETVNNNGFLVKNDRFPLRDTSEYIITGWILPDTSVIVTLSGKKLESRVVIDSDEITFMHQGYIAKLLVKMPERLPSGGNLIVTSENPAKGKHTCFTISVKKLKEKRGAIRLFIDDKTVDRGEDFVRIQGWAVSDSKLTFNVTDTKHEPVDYKLEHFLRKDVVALFEEDEIEPHCGFNIEIRPVPKVNELVFTVTGGAAQCKEKIPLGKAGIMAEYAAEKIDKGRHYFIYNGFSPFVKKVFHFLYDPSKKPQPYQKWLPKHLPGARELARQKEEKFENEVKFSIVVPLYKTPKDYLEELIASVKAQTYDNYELILSDGSGGPSPISKLLEPYGKDPKIKILSHGEQLDISTNTNAAINAASGDYIVFLDHDDLLTPNALYENAKAINDKPETEFLYSDEDKMAVGGIFTQPHLKPDFNFDLLCTVNYICHLVVVKKTLIDRVGLLDPLYNGAQDYDFVLRCTENTKNIYHIPKILYHWRLSENSTAEDPESKKYAFEAGRKAIEAHYERLKIPATVRAGEFPGLYRTDYHWRERPLVSIIIPNKDHIDDLHRCISSIEKKSKYENREYIIIENNSTDPATFEYYKELQKQVKNVNIITYEGFFNYSAINNYGVKYAKGDYLLFLNNDTEFINDDVIEQMLYICMRPDAGAVGARLYYDDDTVQHAGCVVGFGGIAGHCFVQQKRNATGYMHRIICTADYSAVTAACMMVDRKVFDKVQGFYEGLVVAFNDIDLCMKITKAGYRVVYNPYAELYHYESKSRGQEDTPEKVARFQSEIETFQKRWPAILRKGDPYYNPNLSLETQDFSLRRL